MRPFSLFVSLGIWSKNAGVGVLTHSLIRIEEDTMFADSFCDSGWSNRSHRGWATLVSFALQLLALCCLLLLPLLYTEGLPRLAVLMPLLARLPPRQRNFAPIRPQPLRTAR